MVKSLFGVAAAAMLAIAAAPSPANAFAVRHAPGVAQDQATVDQAQYRVYPRRAYRYGYRYGYRRAYPYYGGYGYGYPYGYAPYSYYRPYYGPRVGVGIGPFGFGVW